jgi:hypothetical protein
MNANQEDKNKILPVKRKSEDKMLQNMISKDLIKRIENKADKKDGDFMKVFKSILKNSD